MFVRLWFCKNTWLKRSFACPSVWGYPCDFPRYLYSAKKFEGLRRIQNRAFKGLPPPDKLRWLAGVSADIMDQNPCTVPVPDIW